MHHGLRYVESLFIVAHQAAVAHQPCKRTFDDPAPRLHLKARLTLQAPDNLDREIEISCFVEQSASIVSGIAEQMLNARPTLDQGIEYELSASRVSDIGRRQIHCKQAPIGIDRNMPFASADLLVLAVSVPFTNNIFIADGDFESDTARSRQPAFNTRILSAVMAHEITHGLIVARIGFIDSVRAPSWVTEGYCDYVAREGSFPEQQGLALLAAGRTDPSSSFQYFVGRQLVTYLVEQKKMSFAQIAAAATQSKELRADVAAEMARR